MIDHISRLGRTTGIALVLFYGGSAGLAAAQDKAADQPGETAAGDIVVTATRRAEPLQKVPLAISVVDGDTLRQENRTNLQAVAAIVPSLNFRTVASSSGQALFIRGLGTVSTSSAVEPTVSTVIDGVVLARQGQASMDLLDVDHIEVLRGPQGTLFGKNASVGAVNIVSKAPSDETHASLDAGYYGGGNEWTARGGVSGALIRGKLDAGITAAYAHYDGNVTNLYDGSTVNGYERKGARGKVLFTPTESIKLLVIGDYSHSRTTSPQGVVTATSLTAYPTNVVTTYPTFAAALAPAVASATSRQINSNYFTHADDTNYGLSGQLDWQIGRYTVTSITAWRTWTNTQFQDQDRLAQPLAAFPQQHDIGLIDFHQLSQELRLASPKGGFIDYQVGGFYFRAVDSENYRRDTTLVSATTSNVVTGIANYGIKDTSYAGFGEANLHFSSRFRSVLGARVTRDDLTYNFNRVSTSATAVTGIQTNFVSSGQTAATGSSARAGLQYDVAAQTMAYVTYGRGYKGPAYNVAFSMLPQDTGALKPETSNAFDLGLKTRMLHDRVTFNVAAFLDTFKNYQVNFSDVYNGSIVTRLINAGQVSTRGVEFDLAAKASHRLTVTASGAYTDARIDRFICPVGTTSSCDVNGKPLPYAPKWKGNVRLSYLAPLKGKLSLRLTSDANVQSKVQYSINQTVTTIQPSYGIWNASLGVVSEAGWDISFIVKNITDKSYAANLSTFGQGVVRWVPRDDQRYVGVNAHVGF